MYISVLRVCFNCKLLKVKRDWDHQPSIDRLISDNVKICIDNLLQPEPRKRWTIDKVLDCDWIKMNIRLAKLNEHESIAFGEALQADRTDNQRHLKHLEANRSDTQRHLNERPQRYLSIEQEVESEMKVEYLGRDESSTSKYKLRRSQRIMDACNLLVSQHSVTDKNNVKSDPNADKSNTKIDSAVNGKAETVDSDANKNEPKRDSYASMSHVKRNSDS